MSSEQEEQGSLRPSLAGSTRRHGGHRYSALLTCFLCSLLTAHCSLFPATVLATDVTQPEPLALPAATELANANTVALLASVASALAQLNQADTQDVMQRKILFDTAADGLTGLLQLHGCQWAEAELRTLYARPDAPELRIGYSRDGRVQLRVEPLPLQNPVYNDYCILLCTFSSLTAFDILDEPGDSLELSLADGSWAGAHALAPGHPLWESLKRLAPQFDPPPGLPSGGGLVFKQLYAVPLSSLDLNTCALSLDWGGYHFELPCWVTAGQGVAEDG